MKTILLTGVAGGVGSCLVKEYLNRGYHVFGADLITNDLVTDTMKQSNGMYDFK